MAGLRAAKSFEPPDGDKPAAIPSAAGPSPATAPGPLVAALAAGLRQEAFTSLTWRQGSRGALRSGFAAVRVRPAGKGVERPIRTAASAGQGWWDGMLPDCRLRRGSPPAFYWKLSTHC
ncbi:hypothetical protein GCM10017557_35200 [Streptomyces aurantiacus]|uniref:Uncharacterized protein n=1 Tax=Streptomyces aurantiacus TaxID=47760 RepID=A0A7G1P1X5_9ACTN|nr:hypothetical protein GCM10017557_35200 [Streptomyces aurantiacus]